MGASVPENSWRRGAPRARGTGSPRPEDAEDDDEGPDSHLDSLSAQVALDLSALGLAAGAASNGDTVEA